MKNKQMRYRIVKEENLSLDGKLTIRYYPEYKCYFGWRRFKEYDVEGFSSCARFEKYEDAKEFIYSVVRMNGFSKKSVVAEFTYEKGVDKK